MNDKEWKLKLVYILDALKILEEDSKNPKVKRKIKTISKLLKSKTGD